MDMVRFIIEAVKLIPQGLTCWPLIPQIYLKNDMLGVEDLGISLFKLHFLARVNAHFGGHTMLCQMTCVAWLYVTLTLSSRYNIVYVGA